MTVRDGVLLIQATTDYDDQYPVLPGDIYKVYADGKIEKMPQAGLIPAGSKWIRLESETVGDTNRIDRSTLTILSGDMTAELAKIELVRPLHRAVYADYFLYENSITFVQKEVE